MATNADKLNELAVNIAQVMTDLAGVKVQSSAMYKILVTGNGAKPLPEVVRNHAEWIECHEKVAERLDTRKWEVRKTYIGLSIGWILTLAGLFIALFGGQ